MVRKWENMEIRYATLADKFFWFRLDKHLPEAEFERKVRDGLAYVLTENGQPVALLRYNLFWDNTPFCTLLHVEKEQQGRGFGSALMGQWEQEMAQKGYGMVMTSTQVDERAQHFYRKLGYQDAGGFVINIPGYEQPMEMIMVKGI